MSRKTGDPVRLRVINTIESRRLLEGVKRVMIGFSGGIDSSVLFDILLSLRRRYGFELFALHVNHMIRGAESDSDEEFVKRICEKAGVPLYVVKADVPALAKAEGKSTELAAREARYAAFAKTADENGIDVTATAHNADDNVETVIYNLARGASLNGICGIPYKRGNIIRPLLDIPRKEIERYAKDREIEFVRDSTNDDEFCIRNKIRHRVIPVLKEINASLADTVTAETNLFETIRNYLVGEAALLSGDISAQNEAVILQYIFDSCPVLCDLETATRIVRAVKEKKRRVFMISDNVYAVTDSGAVNFGSHFKRDFTGIEYTPLHKGKNILASGKVEIYYNSQPKNFNDINNFSTIIALHSVIIGEAVYARARTEGDAVRINGITKTLKKEFINKKIPLEYRGLIPVICTYTDSDIVCVPYIGTSDKFKSQGGKCDTFTVCLKFNENNNPEKDGDPI